MPAWAWMLLALPPVAAGGFFGARAVLRRLIERRASALQRNLMERHIEEVQNIYRQMRGWRHDYHNHIQMIKGYRALGEEALLDAYLDNLDADLTRVDTIVKTGNVMLDALLNSKLSLARARHIAVHARAAVPGDLPVSDVDLCVLLGNLLDNAMEACALVAEEGRFLRVYIDRKKEHLYIAVTNAAAAAPRRIGGRIVSSKGPSRGFGLMRIDRIVEKYGGWLRRAGEDEAFTTEIMICCPNGAGHP